MWITHAMCYKKVETPHPQDLLAHVVLLQGSTVACGSVPGHKYGD